MKKIIYAFSALMVVLTSCSSEESNSTSSALLSKTIETFDDASTLTNNYIYNGNKIVSVIDDTEEVDMYFTYTGDLITKIEYKLNDGTLDQLDLYEYNSSNKLISLTRTFPNELDFGNKETFVYNSDGTISTSYYSGDSVSQTNLEFTGKVFFTDGEISKIEQYDGGITTLTTTYTYDTSNNPMKAITGMDKIAFTDGEANGILHNIISENGSGTLTTQYTYTSHNFPATSIDSYDGVEDSSTQYFYE